jgi:hypothetical protein
MALRATLLTLAALLLAAHFLREGSLLLVALCCLAPSLLLVKRRWSLVALQLLSYVAAAVWVHTAFCLVRERLALGKEWAGVAIILGAVTLVTLSAGLLLNSPTIKDRYRP